jgi:hypothetical protein
VLDRVAQGHDVQHPDHSPLRRDPCRATPWPAAYRLRLPTLALLPAPTPVLRMWSSWQ